MIGKAVVQDEGSHDTFINEKSFFFVWRARQFHPEKAPSYLRFFTSAHEEVREPTEIPSAAPATAPRFFLLKAVSELSRTHHQAITGDHGKRCL